MYVCSMSISMFAYGLAPFPSVHPSAKASATELIQPETPLVLLHMYVLAVCTATFCVSVVCNYYYEENWQVSSPLHSHHPSLLLFVVVVVPSPRLSLSVHSLYVTKALFKSKAEPTTISWDRPTNLEWTNHVLFFFAFVICYLLNKQTRI
jgi:hypothetical protein